MSEDHSTICCFEPMNKLRGKSATMFYLDEMDFVRTDLQGVSPMSAPKEPIAALRSRYDLTAEKLPIDLRNNVYKQMVIPKQGI